MNREDIHPGMRVTYYAYDHRSSAANNRTPRKLDAEVIRIGKKRITIRLDSDQTFRFVEAENLINAGIACKENENAS